MNPLTLKFSGQDLEKVHELAELFNIPVESTAAAFRAGALAYMRQTAATEAEAYSYRFLRDNFAAEILDVLVGSGGYDAYSDLKKQLDEWCGRSQTNINRIVNAVTKSIEESKSSVEAKILTEPSKTKDIDGY